MKTIKFKGCNFEYAKNQPQYHTLPCKKDPADPQGLVVTCWTGSWKERFSFLFFGKVWLEILTFNKPLQPLRMAAKKILVLLLCAVCLSGCVTSSGGPYGTMRQYGNTSFWEGLDGSHATGRTYGGTTYWE